jgi:transposase
VAARIADEKVVLTGRIAMDGARKLAVRLTAEQRERLESLVRNGSTKAKRITHARILLMADSDHPRGRYKDQQIAAALGVHLHTVARARRTFVRQGERAAVERKVRQAPPTPPKLDGRAEATLVAICCSAAPAGHARWTLSLLADELVKRHVVTSIAKETVRATLKKMSCSPGGSNATASPSATVPASWRRWRRCSTSTPNRPMRTSR